ncbi:Os05g0411150 [Oryza sativa Japonica Group]|uniref:Os05g0411150 protein n=1 Tax=Oryza sativa subsp. japonica TaxID=39947 RepID=A0A0N7KKS1_ORYSJ|nr:hypothetical protein EE612_029467 [Oryza sativa]BAS94001.1 Os05g0411150 [Oryza sativa Japonica Group]
MVSQYSAAAVLRMPSGAWSYRNSMRPTSMNASAAPWMAYCGAIQSTLIGTVAPGSSRRPWLAAARRLLPSTAAATALLTALMARPTPVRWRCVIPAGCPVRRRSRGTSARS